MLSAKQGGINYHFLILWYDSTWAIGEYPQELQSITQEGLREAMILKEQKKQKLNS